jgi:plastocyanin
VTRRLSSRALIALIAAFGIAVIVTAPDAAAKGKPARHTVTIDATSFAPADLTVNAGDTIVWTNKDPYPHTATSKIGKFDSDDIAPGKSWKFVAKKKGDFPYICSIHPSMKGTLHVK